MINIVITAGGTVESIDEVRKITNMSTGKLASLICTEIIQHHNLEEDFTIHYIMSTKAIKPEVSTEKIIFYPVTNTRSVIDIIDKIFQQYKIHYFIHSMAVSDFTVSYTAQIDALAGEIATAIRNDIGSDVEEKVRDILENPKSILEKGQKISSKKNIIIGLERTQKIISLIKQYDKEVFLVGFKLLDHVSTDHLIEVAEKLGKDNLCSLVLANDMKDINENNHKAILLEQGKIKANFTTKEEISKGLVNAIFGSVINK